MNYNSNKPNEKTRTNAPIVDIGALIFVIYSKNLKNTQYWYRWWDSNPHGFPPDFESGASANSATTAYTKYLYIITKNIINFKQNL